MEDLNWREGLFEGFSRLIDIEVCRKTFSVPENNRLLRCFQFIKMETISVGDYCWNGDCTNCLVRYRNERGEEKSALACKQYVRPGMVITEISGALKADLND
ncbi:MAG TPA: 2Fe-2S iron-sulfur cluster-binding protein [Blastocatellia bacterium]|nr:2Fe-2S iron-sulfur cluster-binding protein [Blastocatellia bacterium]